MICLVDTSAIYAVLDADDRNHTLASEEWRQILADDTVLIVTNYILVESLALIQRRLGAAAARMFQDDVVPMLKVEWVGEDIHAAGISAMLGAQRRDLSLVDCVSFEVMRRMGLRSVFAFDAHFSDQGFLLRPAPKRSGKVVAESRAAYRVGARKPRKR